MKNRQPRYPGRVTFTLDAESAAKLGVSPGTVLGGVWARNDEPFVVGDPLNKFTLLKDETAKMLGGDPETMVPDDAFQMLAALASSGGGGSGDVGELEDTTLEVGTFTNSGAGWNTYRFRQPFDVPPQVALQPLDFDGLVQIRNITAEGFLYCVRKAGVGDGQVTTGTLYTGAGTGTSTQHSAHTVVTGVTLPAVSMGTTEEPVAVNYIAIEYGGDR